MKNLLSKIKKGRKEKKEKPKKAEQKDIKVQEDVTRGEEDQQQLIANAGAKGSLLIKKPWITEKTTMLAQNNQYAFVVEDSCNKSEARKLIESIYSVNIVNINSIRISGKKRRLGRTEGRKRGYKKMIVTLREGQTIDIIPH